MLMLDSACDGIHRAVACTLGAADALVCNVEVCKCLAGAGAAFLVADMLDIFFFKVLQGGEHGVRSRLSKAAERGDLNHLGKALEFFDIAHLALALCNAGKDLVHAGCAFTTRCAFTAGLFADEVHEELGDVDHAAVFIHDDKTAGTDDCADFLQRVKVHREVEMLFRQASAGRAADLDSFELLAVLDAAADVIDDFAERRAHRDFDQAGVDHVARESKCFGSGAGFRTEGTEPCGTLLDDIRNVCKGFNVRTFVGKVMSLLLNMLSRLVITFLPRSKLFLNFMAAITIFSDVGAPKNKV